jgi:hypothetical protein
MLLRGNEQVAPQEGQSHQSDHDLLTDMQAQKQELPMSLAWYRRKRVFGGGPPFIRVSNRIFYRRGELRRWIAARSVDRRQEGSQQ